MLAASVLFRTAMGCLVAAPLLISPRAVRGNPLIPADVFTLKNRLRVILHVDKREPNVTVLVHYAIGARHEDPMRTGLAHLFEHLMFRSSEHMLPYSPWWYLQKAGARGINGTTSFDHTRYYEMVPNVNLEPILWMESDRMGFPILKALDLEDERQIVKNERRQRREITPYGAAREAAWKAMFHEVHPYHGDVIGTQAHLDRLTLDEANSFFKRYYTPSNATLVLSGDFQPEKARELIHRYFETLPGQPVAPPPAIKPVVLKEEQIIRHTETVGSRPRLLMSWLTPPQCTAEDAAADILALILKRGRGGRLSRERESDPAREGSFVSVEVEQRSLALQSVFSIEVGVKDPAALEAAKARIDRELADIAGKGVSAEELEAAKRWRHNDLLSNLQDNLAKATLLIHSDECFGSPGETGRFLALPEAVTSSALQELVRGYLQSSKRVVVYAVPPRREGM